MLGAFEVGASINGLRGSKAGTSSIGDPRVNGNATNGADVGCGGSEHDGYGAVRMRGNTSTHASLFAATILADFRNSTMFNDQIYG